MSKNIRYKNDTWSKMGRAIGQITGVGVSGRSLDIPKKSQRFTSSYMESFAKYMGDLVSISKEVEACIRENDTDRVIYIDSQDDVNKKAKEIQADMEELERYANNVGEYISREIDRPFYEKLDKFIEAMNELDIDDYKVPNTVGYKKTIIVLEHGQRHKVVKTPEEITLRDIYEVDNPYKELLHLEYEAKRNENENLSKEQYLNKITHVGSFHYESLSDKTYNAISDLIVMSSLVLTVVCPPVGLALDLTIASYDSASSMIGKDILTGKKLSEEERALSFVFAGLTLIPGIKVLKIY